MMPSTRTHSIDVFNKNTFQTMMPSTRTHSIDVFNKNTFQTMMPSTRTHSKHLIIKTKSNILYSVGDFTTSILFVLGNRLNFEMKINYNFRFIVKPQLIDTLS